LTAANLNNNLHKEIGLNMKANSFKKNYRIKKKVYLNKFLIKDKN